MLWWPSCNLWSTRKNSAMFGFHWSSGLVGKDWNVKTNWHRWQWLTQSDDNTSHGPLVQVSLQLEDYLRLINRFVTRLTQWVPLVEQELLTLLEHLSSPPVFCGVRVTRFLVLCVCFVDRCMSFCPFSFGHCVVCSSSIYGFYLVSSNSS